MDPFAGFVGAESEEIAEAASRPCRNIGKKLGEMYWGFRNSWIIRNFNVGKPRQRGLSFYFTCVFYDKGGKFVMSSDYQFA